MQPFIVFNTLKQAKNFVKRQPNYHHNEGCGCCFNGEEHKIDGKKVIHVSYASYAGGLEGSATVIGRIRN